MTFSNEDPFNGRVPSTVPLSRTPLSGVLVQIRFPEVLSIAKVDHVAEFQQRIRPQYPLSDQGQSHVLQVGPAGTNQTVFPNWRFMDADRGWRVSLTTNFIALETKSYANRQDFIERTAAVYRALQTTISPSFVTRIGVRYVDQVHGEFLENLAHLVRPEVLGLSRHPHGHNITRTWSEASAITDVGPMRACWGLMPPNQTHDLDLMPPLEEPCWFLDTDAYQEFADPLNFDSDEVAKRVSELATRSYGFFRWVVNDDFLRACGGVI